jgi:hypothetical protein
LVNVLDVYIDPLETKAFYPLRGGFLHLTGKIGLIFSLADPDTEGEWIDGRYSGPVSHGRTVSFTSIRLLVFGYYEY